MVVARDGRNSSGRSGIEPLGAPHIAYILRANNERSIKFSPDGLQITVIGAL
jgi:hypothetical protein